MTLKIWRCAQRSILLTLLGVSAAAFAGTRDGGGAIGVRCGPGAPKTFELLDLHESRLRGKPANAAPYDSDGAVELVSRLLAHHITNPDFFSQAELERAFTDMANGVFQGKTFQGLDGNPVAVKLVPTLSLSGDVGKYQILPGCSLEQIAYFDDTTKTLKIARGPWADLDWLDKAAVVAHELAYWVDRREALENIGDPSVAGTSVITRKFVGGLFSAAGLRPKYESVPDYGYVKCDSTSDVTSSFFAYDSAPNEVTVVFGDIYQTISAFKTTVAVHGTNVHNLWMRMGEMEELANLQISDEDDAPSFLVKLSLHGGEVDFQAYREVRNSWIPLGPKQEVVCELHE